MLSHALSDNASDTRLLKWAVNAGWKVFVICPDLCGHAHLGLESWLWSGLLLLALLKGQCFACAAARGLRLRGAGQADRRGG